MINITPTTAKERAYTWHNCRCGGKYALIIKEAGYSELLHSLPFCNRYEKIVSTADAINFSQANLGIS